SFESFHPELLQDPHQLSLIHQQSHQLISIKHSCHLNLTTTHTQAPIPIQVAIQVPIPILIPIPIRDTLQKHAVLQHLLQLSQIQQT
ncbi:spore coat protein, partial [Priestia megaterium]|uniref:spore coat protein n=1 Tax=Priestia megaterium TaxID=1404 RepID=UPI001649EA75